MTPSQSSRLLFIDRLRALAIFTMIETHVFNSLLRPSLQQSGWFPTLNFFNGLVAPSFLFVSGWVFAAASQRKLEDFHSRGPAFRKQLLRIAIIWGLGYLLHFPDLPYRFLGYATNQAAWRTLYQVDILHCIAAALLLLLFARISVRSDAVFERTLWLSAVLVVVVTPWLWAKPWGNFLPAFVSGYIGEHENSLFPLFPWFAFIAIGGACSFGYAKAQITGQSLRFMRRVATAGIFLVAAGYCFSLYGFPWRYGLGNVRAHPFFFGMRLGAVFLLLWICWIWQQHELTRGNWIRPISKESLFIYVAHLAVLYRLPSHGKSLVYVYGKTLNLQECLALTAGLTLLMFASAKIWGWLKSRPLPFVQCLASAMGTGVLLSFLAR